MIFMISKRGEMTSLNIIGKNYEFIKFEEAENYPLQIALY